MLRGFPIALLFLSACTLEFPTPDEVRCSEDGWWDTAYSHRARITIAATQTVPAEYPIRAVLPSEIGPASYMRIVTLQDGLCAPVDRAGEKIDASAVWFKAVEELAAGTTAEGRYWLYYDFAEQVSGQGDDPANVFTLWDGFDGNLDKWMLTDVSDNADDGTLTLEGVSALESDSSFGAGYALDVFVLDYVVGSTASAKIGFANPNGNHKLFWTLSKKGTERQIGLVYPSPGNVMETAEAADLPDTLLSVDLRASEIVFIQGDGEQREGPTDAALAEQDFTVHLRNESADATLTIDFARVRMSIDAPPSATIGPLVGNPDLP